jgi:hypothetical protein
MVIFKSDNKDINFDMLQIRVHEYSKDNLDETRQKFFKFLAGALVARKNRKSEIEKYTWSLMDRDCLNSMLKQGNHKPFAEKSDASIEERLTIRRLLELGIIRCEKTGDFSYQYVWTDFGIAVTQNPNTAADKVS